MINLIAVLTGLCIYLFFKLIFKGLMAETGSDHTFYWFIGLLFFVLGFFGGYYLWNTAPLPV